MARNVVRSYLVQLMPPERIDSYLMIYDFYLERFKESSGRPGNKQMSSLSVKAILICEQVNNVLEQKQKILILLQLLEIFSIKENTTNDEIDFIRAISIGLKFDKDVFQNCKCFVTDTFDKIYDRKNILVIDNKEHATDHSVKHVQNKFLKAKIAFMYIPQTGTYMFRTVNADDQLYLNNRKIAKQRTCIMDKGSTIHSPLIGTIHYSDIVQYYLTEEVKNNLSLTVDNLEFGFGHSENGIKNISFTEDSGKLLGIMGGSGVGKSTLLHLINGSLKPDKGRILINGYDINVHKDILQGTIGFVPQDDLLIEELTVYQNIFFNARLCFRDYSADKLKYTVIKTLEDLDLIDVKDLKVGNPLNKFISGGQRKRLNIALELIREPNILLVDEPTSGLSSTDSETVIDLLRDQTYKGTLVLINIHQPSSDIFKQFDKLIVLDRGGRTVYYGNPLDALVYFKSQKQLINAEESECLTCGNVNPEQILAIIEAKRVNEWGGLTKERAISPQEWYNNYKKYIEKSVKVPSEKIDIPANYFHVPGILTQFKIFFQRNLLSKLTDHQYLLINLIEAPVLALILSFFTRYKAGTMEDPGVYVFGGNVNFPVYLFMSVVVALFIGMMVSAEDIFKDRHILKRESLLDLSRSSYVNAKVLFLILLSAVQIFTYVLVGNLVMGIKGMLFQYWLVLFSVSVFANILGLIISDSMKSVVSIYILIPLLLVPQILLGGAMVRFDKLNNNISSDKVVPFIGDIMASRWAYEALTVYHFKNNQYRRDVFAADAEESKAAFYVNYALPEIILRTNDLEKSLVYPNGKEETMDDIMLIKNELQKIARKENIQPADVVKDLSIDNLSESSINAIRNYNISLRKYFITRLNRATEEKDRILQVLTEKYGGMENLNRMKEQYDNRNLYDQVTNRKEPEKLMIKNNELIRKAEPVYFISDNTWGRAHFYAPAKRVGTYLISTCWFNLMALWFMNLVLYAILQSRLVKKLIELPDRISLWFRPGKEPE